MNINKSNEKPKVHEDNLTGIMWASIAMHLAR